MAEFKLGDKVRLTGEDWDTYDEVSPGDTVVITEIDHTGAIWAGEAGTVGNGKGLYSGSNPEGSGDYSCELVSGNSEEATRNRANSFEESVKAFAGASGVSLSDLDDIATLGDKLGISSFEQSVRRITDQTANILIEKNLAYGNSALDPIQVFSNVDRMEQLFVRLDDKLSRVKRGHEYPGDDTIRDIIGYCTLILIARETN